MFINQIDMSKSKTSQANLLKEIDITFNPFFYQVKIL